LTGGQEGYLQPVCCNAKLLRDDGFFLIRAQLTNFMSSCF